MLGDGDWDIQWFEQIIEKLGELWGIEGAGVVGVVGDEDFVDVGFEHFILVLIGGTHIEKCYYKMWVWMVLWDK